MKGHETTVFVFNTLMIPTSANIAKQIVLKRTLLSLKKH